MHSFEVASSSGHMQGGATVVVSTAGERAGCSTGIAGGIAGGIAMVMIQQVLENQHFPRGRRLTKHASKLDGGSGRGPVSCTTAAEPRAAAAAAADVIGFVVTMDVMVGPTSNTPSCARSHHCR
jgi:hypothetical protein